jgi:hypothetical protein
VATFLDVFWLAMQIMMSGILAGGAYLTLSELFRGEQNGGRLPARSVADSAHVQSAAANWNA